LKGKRKGGGDEKHRVLCGKKNFASSNRATAAAKDPPTSRSPNRKMGTQRYCMVKATEGKGWLSQCMTD